MKFKLVGGMHTTKEGTFNRGDIVESDQDLVKRFGPKFEYITDEPPKPLVEPEPEPEDVSNNFPLAVNNGILVLKRPDGKFDLLEEGSGDQLNSKPLNKSGVDRTVKSLLENRP